MLKQTLAGIVALSFAGYAAASTTTYTQQIWDLRSSNSAANITGRLYDGTNLNEAGVRTNDNSQINMTVGTVGVKITAWSSTGDGACTSGIECDTTSGNIARDDDPFIQRAILTQYGTGLGAINRDEGSSSPDHSLDNRGGDANWLDFDMVLFEFDSAVELTGYQNGYGSYDEDVSILGYTGSGTLGSTPFSESTKWSDLLTQGWGYQSENFTNGTSAQAVASGFESRYWLIGAYNPVFTGTNRDHNDDAIKLTGISTRQAQPQTQVPEPATLALLLAGVASVFRRRR